MKGKKILKIIFGVIIWTIIIIATLITISTLRTRGREVPNVFGYVPLVVKSESMEPKIMTGDLIVTKEYNPNKRELKEKDIISFYAEIQNQRVVITHRIEHIININGMVAYVTKGDNNKISDENQVAPGDVIAVYDGFRIPYLGTLINFIKTKVGFICCVILPLALFFIYQLYQFIVLLFEYKDIK